MYRLMVYVYIIFLFLSYFLWLCQRMEEECLYAVIYVAERALTFKVNWCVNRNTYVNAFLPSTHLRLFTSDLVN